MCRECNKSIWRGRVAVLLSLAAIWTTTLLLGLSAGCGQAPGGPDPSFKLLLENDDVGFVETLTVSWWVVTGHVAATPTHAGYDVTTVYFRTVAVPGGATELLDLGATPVGFGIVGSAWHAFPYPGWATPGAPTWVWNGPELRDHWIAHVHYPSGQTTYSVLHP